MNTVRLAENGIIPTWLIRAGIRMRLKRKLEQEQDRHPAFKETFVKMLRNSPIAIATDDANDQHYQVPTDFYKTILGPCLKYSACYWPEGVETLQAAEIASLELVAERAQIDNGHSILDMGCGWGSFSLWAASQFPDSQILAVSNSLTQAQYIRSEAEKRGLGNLNVVTRNMVEFDPEQSFDRIVSIEMFEHMRNYEMLFRRVSGWLKPGGRLFVHVFSHKTYAYDYDDSDPSDWMSNYFFTGGIMPSHDLFSHFNQDLQIDEDWKLNGMHYTRTLEAWLDNLDAEFDYIHPLFMNHYGKDSTKQWINRWRMFILACSELFGYKNGTEWGISHYRFKKS
ncbi:MAG: cyclopropane-fatty-acyl-phospholipid synthase family protein [Opitutales bacterium]|nr:cyclopropane-fatty-acyl-phospholipid synthase family protein [Opitutales bacterium]